MKEKFSKAKSIIFELASKLIIFYKNYLLVFFVVFLIAFITGIMTCSKYASDISCENLLNKYLYSFLVRDSSYLSFFLILSVYFVIIAVLFSFLATNSFMIIVDIIILALSSYIFGFDLCIIILSLGISGVILGILVFGLLGLLAFSVLIFILSISLKRLRERKHSCESIDRGTIVKTTFILIIIGVIILFLLCILFSIIHIFVIVE